MCLFSFFYMNIGLCSFRVHEEEVLCEAVLQLVVKVFQHFVASNRSSGKSRPYRTHGSSWNQSAQSYNQQSNEQPSGNIFGAFDPHNQAIYPSSDNNYYPPTKRQATYEPYSHEYDGFYPKRTRTYENEDNNVQDYYSPDKNYYPPSTTSTYSNYPSETNNYNDSSSNAQHPWQYPSEPHFDQQQQQQYSNPDNSYMNSMSMS